MDEESIWQQMEIQNEENFEANLELVSRFLAADSEKFKLNIDEVSSDSEDDEENSANSESENDPDEIANGTDQDESEDNKEQSDDNNEGNNTLNRSKSGKKSIVDDEFFKLSEMEDFLKDQDRREMNKHKGTAYDGEEDIDYFAEDNDDINLEESLKYSDFFDQGEDDSDEPDEQSVGESDENDSNEPKSSHELKQERLSKKIQKLEEEMLEEKIWQMKGEIKADTRPQDSLRELQELEFDSATRPAPIITETVSMKLEDIIRQRIKDKAWDDVERKVKPSDIQFEYRKQIVLDQEKSKQSLSQIYEKEYLKEIEKNNPDAADDEQEEPKEHKEIRAELKDLFEKLDMLSNFHYTPRPAQPELKIITNLPTISMEEVAPVATNDATLLAPEEIKRKNKAGNILGAGERTKTDKNRERRHKKMFQKSKFNKNNATGNKDAIINKVMKSRNVQKVRIRITSYKELALNSFFNFR